MAIMYDINNLGQALFAKITAAYTFTGGVYPGRIPEAMSWPSCSYYIISDLPEEVKDNGAVVDQVRVQVSIFATTYAVSLAAADAVRVALVGTTGETNSTTIDTIRLLDETDMYEDDIKIYHRAQDYLVRIKNYSLGAELIINGTFTTAAGWNLTGASGIITDGVYKLADGTGSSYITPTIGIVTAGLMYQVSVTVAGYGGGTVLIECGTTQKYLASNDNHSFTMICVGSYPKFNIELIDTEATIDNVSVRQIT